jgi:hypothetical protein
MVQMPPPERKDKDAEHPNFTATEEIEKNTNKFKSLTSRLLRVSRTELAEKERAWQEANRRD